MNLVFSRNKTLLSLYGLMFMSKIDKNTGDNLIGERPVLFVHNPKVAGNSLSKILSNSDEKLNTSHKTPTFLVSKRIWEKSTSVVAIRHPLDRLISSFHYHTKPAYQGVFSGKYPNLKQFSFEQYFDVFSREPYVIMPQWYYTRHLLSKKPIDHLLYFEKLEEDVSKMAESLKIEFNGLPHLNSSKRENPLDYFKSEKLRDKLLSYYELDFQEFDYKPDFEKYS